MNIAEQIDGEIREKLQTVKGNLLIAAGKLAQSQDMGWWKQLGGGHSHDKFKDYVESLGGPSYSYMTRVCNVTRAIGDGHYTASEVDEMGLSSAILLLPIIKKGEMTPEILQAALTGSLATLKAMLAGDSEIKSQPFVVCPRCGEEVPVKKVKEG